MAKSTINVKISYPMTDRDLTDCIITINGLIDGKDAKQPCLQMLITHLQKLMDIQINRAALMTLEDKADMNQIMQN
jgi:hypothetical protein